MRNNPDRYGHVKSFQHGRYTSRVTGTANDEKTKYEKRKKYEKCKKYRSEVSVVVFRMVSIITVWWTKSGKN